MDNLQGCCYRGGRKGVGTLPPGHSAPSPYPPFSPTVLVNCLFSWFMHGSGLERRLFNLCYQAVVVMNEFTPSKFRAEAYLSSCLFWTGGCLISILLSWALVPLFGWR